jgi:hypothetical protein
MRGTSQKHQCVWMFEIVSFVSCLKDACVGWVQ